MEVGVHRDESVLILDSLFAGKVSSARKRMVCLLTDI